MSASITVAAPTTLTADQWLDVLQHPTLADAEVRDILFAFYRSPNYRSQTNLIQQRIAGTAGPPPSGAPVHSRIAAFVQRIQQRTDYPFSLRHRKDGSPQYWNLLFEGAENDAGHFEWVLRPALVEALEQYEAMTAVITPKRDRPHTPLNQVFYGPPGTGKTYSTIEAAVRIASPSFSAGNRRRIREEYQRLRAAGRIAFVTFHQSLSYEDFVEGLKPRLTENKEITYEVKPGIFRQMVERASTDERPYVLIIDEINRGNVSAIFGELITLLEADKRKGAAEALTLTLPYSRQDFGVPANLYLLATMNTADRGVEPLDAAIRRRFSFREVAPDPSVITRLHPTEGVVDVASHRIDLAVLLSLVNERIATLLDEDHRLGHSYFLGVLDWQDLAATMTHRVLPLLREYFFADYTQLQAVVGQGFCSSDRAHRVRFAPTDEAFESTNGVATSYRFPAPETAEVLLTYIGKLGYP